LLEGRSSTFLDFLANNHLAGLESIMTRFDVETADDIQEEKWMISNNGAALTPSAAAQAESRRRTSTGWLDSTWAHRLAIKAQKGAQMLGDTFLSMTSNMDMGGAGGASSGGGGGGGGGGLVNTSHTSRAAAVGEFSGRGGVASAVVASSYADQELQSSTMTSPAAVSPLSSSPPPPNSSTNDVLNMEAVRSYARLLNVLLRRWQNPSQGCEIKLCNYIISYLF
jgi:hypothetical protein